jgi:hypothetical protein
VGFHGATSAMKRAAAEPVKTYYYLSSLQILPFGRDGFPQWTANQAFNDQQNYVS